MKVDKVVVNGFETVQENETYNYGNDFAKILNHMSVYYQISEISVVECFFLSMFSGTQVHTLHEIINEDALNKDEYHLLAKNAKQIMMLSNTIRNDESMDYDIGYYLYPACCVQKSVTVEFTGLNICKIIGMIWNELFRRVQTTGVENAFISLFIENFYKFMGNQLNTSGNTINLIKKLYYEKINNTDSIIMLESVQSRVGAVHFINSNTSTLKRELEDLKSIRSIPSGVESDKKYVTENIRVFFIMKTSLYAFLEIFTSIPIECVSDFIELQSLIENGFEIPCGLDAYKNRIMMADDKYKDSHKPMASSNRINESLNCNNMYLLNTKTNFSLRMTLKEADEIIIPALKELISRLDIRDDKTAIGKELGQICNELTQYIISIYRSVYS